MAKVITKILQEQKSIPCCAYARVSTFKDEQENSLIEQETYWRNKLSQMENHQFCGVFADQGISGSKVIQRKEYCRMIDLAMTGFIKEIYTKSIYRFGRNARETMETVQKLRQNNVAVIFENENVNTLTCSSDMLLKLQAVLAEQELKTMSENVKFAKRYNCKKGIVEKKLVLGYDYDENDNLIINETESKIVRLIYSLYIKGYGTQSIVKQLKTLGIPSVKGNTEWSASSIRYILQNEKYTGDPILQKTFVEDGKKVKNNGQLAKYRINNNHEAIIDNETFLYVQKLIAARSKEFMVGRKIVRYPLTGKIFCGSCCARFKHGVNKRVVNFDKEYWVCTRSDQLGKNACESNRISATLLNEMLVDAYNDFIDQPFELLPDTEMTERLKEIRILCEKLKRLHIDRLITYEQYKTEFEKLSDEETAITNKLRIYTLLSSYRKPKTKVKDYSDDLVRHIDKIIINGYKVEFKFKNQQSIVKEYKYEHRKYSKNY